MTLRISAMAAVALQGGAAGQAEGSQADEKREVEHEEETQRELSEIGQREKGAEDQGMQDDVADGPAYDVVGAHNAVVEDDAMGIVADQIDQIEQHQNLGKRVNENGTQCRFIENMAKQEEQEVEDAKVTQNDSSFQKLVCL